MKMKHLMYNGQDKSLESKITAGPERKSLAFSSNQIVAGKLGWCIFLLIFMFLLSLTHAAAADQKPGAASSAVYQFSIQYDWLTMSDGVKLSVTYFKPIQREKNEKFPVLFEFLPYRKDDYFYMRDSPLYSYFVRRGYVIAKVDIRGTGSSQGKVPPREYSEAELNDALEIIAQLAKAPWSNGKVGMWGISWSGFNALQVAMWRPPALKAIMASCATDDLYHDDVHFIDGAFHVDLYELSIDTDLGLPRSPDYLLDKDYFENRFNSYPWFLAYLKNQRDGEFWRKNSLRWQYDSIQIPTFLLGGLLDGYRDSIPRMLENMKIPLKAEIGPYNHAWPDNGVPGPNYEWRHRLVRWWDHWLKGIDTGMMSEPRFAVFVRDSHPPDAALKTTPGEFRWEEWPIKRTQPLTLYLSSNKRLVLKPHLGDDAPPAAGKPIKSVDQAASDMQPLLGSPEEEDQKDQLKYIPGYGYPLGFWWGETTGDLRPADAGGLVYNSEILREKMEIIGFPQVKLTVSASAPLAHWIVCLEDLHPDGRVSLVTGALINGSQRNSRLNPQYLEPGAKYRLNFDLHFTTWTFQPGHRIRLLVTNSLFPMIWPTPFAMETQLFWGNGASRLELPVIPYRKSRIPVFPAPEPREEREDARTLESKGWPYLYRVSHDQLKNTTTVEWKAEDRFQVRGVEHIISDSNTYYTNNENPADSGYMGESERIIRLTERTIRLKTNVTIRSDEKNFHVVFSRHLFENGKPVAEKQWQETIPRQFQ